MTNTNSFNAEAVRDQLRKRKFLPGNLVRYCYRPFDARWLYWEPDSKLLDRNRSEYYPHIGDGNVWISAGQRNRKDDFYQPQFTRLLADHHIVESNVGMFPLFMLRTAEIATLLEKAGRRPNLSDRATNYLTDLAAKPEDLFYHVLTVLHALAYRTENAGALRQDWPRIPLPKAKDALIASAALGRQVAALLDTETPASGVTAGKIRDDLKAIAVFQRLDGKPAKSESGDLDLTAGWGHAGKGGITMPGKGKPIRRDDGAYDIFLNADSYWRNVPEAVWNYTIGGYQVIKKWLSYREKPLLGRGLSSDEVRYVTEMARRLAALVSLQPSLDDNYRKVIKSTYAWPKK
jgi:hypothetical protein